MSPYIPRKPGYVCHAVIEVIAALGSAEKAGNAVGKSGNLVSQWSLEDKAALPNIHQAIMLDYAYHFKAGKRGPVLRAAIRELTDMTGHDMPEGRCLFDHLTELTDSLGTVAGEIRDGWADRKLTPNEIHGIEEALHALVMSIDAVRAEINAHRPKPRPINHPVTVAEGMAAE